MNEDDIRKSEVKDITVLDDASLMKSNNIIFTHVAQLIRFGVVGATAAVVHYVCVIALVQTFLFKPLVANIFAFIIAFQVSYSGHRFWTFADSTKMHRHTLTRLFLLQSVMFSINESLYAAFLAYGLPYTLALILVLTILPLFTFTISKIWIF